MGLSAGRTLAVALALGAAPAVPGAAQQAAPPPAPTALTGVWETVRVNRAPLPMTDEVVGSDGFTHAVRLHEMMIRLRPNNRFQASLHFRRAILTRGERIGAVPLQTDTWLGTYTIEGDSVRFVPERRASQQMQPFTGVRNGRRITVEFDYHIVTRKRYQFELARNDNIW
jgi:hypothetical protein